ncbi:hypothetical protein [Rufibacter latericius]|nr:hypothetical protein [Rufibacter latericius]
MEISTFRVKGLFKHATHYFSCTILGFLVMAMMLQSCVFVGIGKNPKWKTAASTKAPIAPEQEATRKPEMHVEVLRNQRMVPLPFLVLAINKKHYALHFWVKPNTGHTLNLDSITYRLFDPGKNLIGQGSHRLDNYPKEIKPAHRLQYQNAGHTNYHLSIDKALKEDLSVLVALHYKDSTGKAVSEAYQQALRVEVSKRVNVHMMGN